MNLSIDPATGSRPCSNKGRCVRQCNSSKLKAKSNSTTQFPSIGLTSCAKIARHGRMKRIEGIEGSVEDGAIDDTLIGGPPTTKQRRLKADTIPPTPTYQDITFALPLSGLTADTSQQLLDAEVSTYITLGSSIEQSLSQAGSPFGESSLDGMINEELRKSVPAAISRASFQPTLTPAEDELIKRYNLHPHPAGGYFQLVDQSEKALESSSRGNLARPLFSTCYHLYTHHQRPSCLHRSHVDTIYVHHSGRGRITTLAGGHSTGEPLSIKQHAFGGDRETKQLRIPANTWRLVENAQDNMLVGLSQAQDSLFMTEVMIPGYTFQDHEYMPLQELQGMINTSANETERIQLNGMMPLIKHLSD